MRIGWPCGIEFHAAEEAPGCRGLAAEAAAVPEEEPGEAAEGEEDLRGANSAVEEGAVVGGADMFAPSPGKPTWTLDCSLSRQQTGQSGHAVSMEAWRCDVVTNNVQTVCFVFCYY